MSAPMNEMQGFLKHVSDLYAKGDSYPSLFDFFKNNVRRN